MFKYKDRRMSKVSRKGVERGNFGQSSRACRGMTNPCRGMSTFGRLNTKTRGEHAAACLIHVAACHGGAKTMSLGHAAACPIHAAA